MIRYIILTIAGLAAGIAAGMAMMQWQVAPQMTELARQRDAFRHELQQVKTQSTAPQARIERLERENESYAAQVDELYERIAALESGGLTTAPDAASALWGAFEDAWTEEEDAVRAAPPPRLERSRGDRTELQTRQVSAEGEADAAAQERAAEYRQRRAEATARYYERVDQFLAAALAQSSDPASQERLQNMSEYARHLHDLRQEQMNAQTDAERDALREEMQAASREMARLVQDQQRHMLRDVAANFGIADRPSQREFYNVMRETLQSPFFQPGAIPSGGRTGGPRRGRQ